jgi:nucleotide-binding universal stress UspA family protein
VTDSPQRADGPTIVVGADGSSSSEHAVVFAARLAHASGAPLLLACAYPYDAGTRAANLDVRAGLREQAEVTLRRLGAYAEAAADVRTVAIADTSPPRALHELAEREHAGLIVLGTTATHRHERVFPGSTAERLLHGAPCPVAVVPGVDRDVAMRTIGVAVDGSPEAARALEVAIGAARATGAQLRVISVCDADRFGAPEASDGPGFWIDRDAVRRHAREDMDELSAGLPSDVHATPDLVFGTPARELTARTAELDLLVMGSRGYGPLRAVLLGGVAGRVLRDAACPVVVVPRGASVPPTAF